MTAIAVPIFIRQDADFRADLRAAVAALQGAAGIIELRCDQAPAAQIAQALDFIAQIRPPAANLQTIVTIRPTWEGGLSAAPDALRAQTFAAILAANSPHPDYLDIECAAWTRNNTYRDKLSPLLRRTGVKLILSHHDFAARPAELPARLADLRAQPDAHLLKIAWKAASILDAVDALRITRDLPARDPRPILALAMGEFGQISRLLARKFNAPFTFASLSHGKESAPGQPTVNELRTLYRWDRQRAATPVHAVIGWPVGHSLSPHIHNAGFDALDLPGVYVPLPIEPTYDHFSAAVDALRAADSMDLRGLSITIPHKENALRYVLDQGGAVDELSRHIGAINTIVWRPDGTVYGLNSDYAGALDALTAAMQIGRADLASRRVAVLGAGGAARAIVAGLAASRATIVIHARRIEQARALAAEFAGSAGAQVVAAPWDGLCTSRCDIYVNCTPIGMHPSVDASPFDAGGAQPPFTTGTTVFDTVYRPLRTRLLQQAEAAGARTVSGLEMFLRQGAVQFQQFTGRDAPVEVFRQVALAHLQSG